MFANMIIQTENVKRHLPQGGRELHILKGISFAVEAGAWLAISGPSGSGKSTLLGILAGIDRPSSGKVYVNGTEVSALPEERLARLRNEQIGFVFQAFHLIPTLTALENVEAPLFVHPLWRRARPTALYMLEQVGLGDRKHHFPHQLSGGEQQRVAIARALACNPQILLADEPTGNLDSVTSHQVLELLGHLRHQFGLTIIMATHDASVAERANRRLHLVDGRLVNIDSPASLRSLPVSILSREARV